MALFTFKLDYFTIDQTMSKHKDTDWVYFTVAVGDKVYGPTHGKIGDLNNGHYDLNWILGPIEAGPDDVVTMSYQIVNHGHDDNDSGKETDDDIEIAAAISAGIITVATGGASGIVAGIAGALGIAGGIAKWIFGSDVNCDGMVLSDAVTMNGAKWQELTQPGGVHSEVRAYTGPETPHGCGPDAQYHVAWTIFYTREPLNRPHPIIRPNAPANRV